MGTTARLTKPQRQRAVNERVVCPPGQSTSPGQAQQGRGRRSGKTEAEADLGEQPTSAWPENSIALDADRDVVAIVSGYVSDDGYDIEGRGELGSIGNGYTANPAIFPLTRQSRTKASHGAKLVGSGSARLVSYLRFSAQLGHKI
jgi:hypothetical protein